MNNIVLEHEKYRWSRALYEGEQVIGSVKGRCGIENVVVYALCMSGWVRHVARVSSDGNHHVSKKDFAIFPGRQLLDIVIDGYVSVNSVNDIHSMAFCCMLSFCKCSSIIIVC